jgi:nucleotide-binding universal stress UspA family protein
MKRILVAFDGSGASLRALAKAVELAKSCNASIETVFAHDAPLSYGEIAVYVPQHKMAELQRSHAEQVLAEAEKKGGLEASGLPYSLEILAGPVAQAIVDRARAAGADLIVIGRHGHSAVRDLLMGSVAMKVLHASPLPVLLVP